MSNLFDKLQAIAANLVTGGATGSGSNQSSGAANTSDNEVSVFNKKEEIVSNSSTEIDDEEYFWWQERLEEKKEEESKKESFDASKYSSDEWTSVEAKANKNILGNVKDYTFKTSSGTKIDLEDIEGVKILENKQTGEIIVVGANGATINAGNKDAKITIYDSDIKKLDTDKGNDEVKIYNSNVGEITTGRGIDNVVIENSNVEKVNTSSGSDNVKVKDSSIGNANTSSSVLWGVFDDAEDTVTLVNSEADKVKTGRGDDNIIATDSDVDKLKTGSGSDALNIDNTDVNRLRTNKKDTVIEDSNYLNIDKTKILELGKESLIDLGDGTTISVSEYSNYLLSQPVGFETEEEYQAYVLQSLTSNFETMKSVFGTQSEKDGWIAGGYNGLKELTGLGITDKDVEEMIAKQEEMIKGLTAALNGESDMSFEEAYEYYTGTTYSKEKIDKYMEVSNIYSAMMVGCQYDENYMEEFETATGMSVEDVTKEYALCQLDTFGKSTGLQDLVEKYAQDQEDFADKLSAAITTVGMTCIVVGAVVSFVFPPAAPVGAALMTAGKYVSLGGMFVDNAMDLVDDTTDKDGLTKEELGENALETGVEVVSYATGRAIGGLTNNLNTAVSSAATQAGASNVTSYIAGQAAETSADMLLSLGADYAIAQGQSLITTGEFIDADEYWSLDRFLGEGKNQLIGILTGLSSAKINNFSGQSAVYATAGKMVLDGDTAGARAYLETSGVKVDDTSFDDFQRTVIDANPVADAPRLEAPKENNAPEIEIDKPVEAEGDDVEETEGLTGKIDIQFFAEKQVDIDENLLTNSEIFARQLLADGENIGRISIKEESGQKIVRAKIGTPIPKYKDLYNYKTNLLVCFNANNEITNVFKQNELTGEVEVYSKDGVLTHHYTKTEMDALKYYKYHPDSIHTKFRDGKNHWAGNFQEETNEAANRLIALFNDENKVFKTNEPKTLYRALQTNLTQAQIENLSTVGGIYSDPSFCSTTENLSTAQRFSSGNPILKINVPKGTQYIDIERLFNIERNHWNEQELLLDRNTQFKVTGFDAENNIIEVDYINIVKTQNTSNSDSATRRIEVTDGEEVTDGLASRIGIQFFAEKTKQTDENIDPAKKFTDSEITDSAINQQLSLNAVALNATFEKYIGEVKAETKTRFSGLETVKDENITARAKDDKSTFEKLASKFKSGKLKGTDIESCSNTIGDAYGTRIQLNSVQTDVAKAEITRLLDGSNITYEQFVNHITGKVEYDEATKLQIETIKAPILDSLKTKQSQEVVDRIVSLITNAKPNEPPVITELNNYGSTISSYFTDAQLEQIATAYSKKYGKPLDIVTRLDETNHPSGKLEITRKDGKKILSVESSKAKYTNKGSTKDSGYTSSQLNTKHQLSDGTVGNGELQIRGTEVNAFADVEHIPYDIRQGKIKEDDPKYATVYKLIKDMNKSTYSAYNKYLTAVYDSLRLKELGIPIDSEPKIETYLKDSGLSDYQLALLSRAGLEKLH